MKANEQQITSLIPRTKGPRVLGKVHYSESAQAWNIIRLKKEIYDKFPQLKGEQGNFYYKMGMYEDYKELKDHIKEMEKNGEVVPMMMVLGKENKDNNP